MVRPVRLLVMPCSRAEGGHPPCGTTWHLPGFTSQNAAEMYATGITSCHYMQSTPHSTVCPTRLPCDAPLGCCHPWASWKISGHHRYWAVSVYCDFHLPCGCVCMSRLPLLCDMLGNAPSFVYKTDWDDGRQSIPLRRVQGQEVVHASRTGNRGSLQY
jgi:hypothetical protein